MDVQLARFIDHTLLSASATRADIEKLCAEAKTYKLFSVCINSHWIPLARAELKGSSCKVCTVVGFPLGANLTKVKVSEAALAINAGADEIDMVLNIGAFRSHELRLVEDDIAEVAKVCKGHNLKVIIETYLLTADQISQASAIVEAAGAQFVKTSTGFSSGGARVEDVRLIKQSVSENMGIKASGGIKNREIALAMIRAGATRLGCSSSLAVIGLNERGDDHGQY
jgi:deoxyribose-phosphate aldolase